MLDVYRGVSGPILGPCRSYADEAVVILNQCILNGIRNYARLFHIEFGSHKTREPGRVALIFLRQGKNARPEFICKTKASSLHRIGAPIVFNLVGTMQK